MYLICSLNKNKSNITEYLIYPVVSYEYILISLYLLK